MSPLISVITVNLNNAKGLEETIISVVRQTGAGYEYVIIDGASTDNSLQVLEKYSEYIAVWISERDGGIYEAMNKGIGKATGDYLLFLNSGDSLADSAVLQRCGKQINLSPGVDILYGYAAVKRTAEARPEIWKFPARINLPYLKHETLNHQAAVIKSALFTELGLYSRQYKLAADYWFFLKCFLENKKYVRLDSVMVNYNLNGVSAADNFRAHVLERRAIWNELVPAWARQLVDEHLALAEAARPRLVRLAAWADKLIFRRPNQTDK